MERLFTQLKNRINNITTPEASGASWDSFKTYRERRNSSNKWGTYWPWLLGSVGMFLLFSNIYFITNTNQLKEQFSSITTDTIYITKYITEETKIKEEEKITLSEIEYEAFKEQQVNLTILQSQYDNLNNKLARLSSGMELLKSKNQDLQLAVVRSNIDNESQIGYANSAPNKSLLLDPVLSQFDNLIDDTERVFLNDLALLNIDINPLKLKNKVFRSPLPWIDPFQKKRSFNILEAIRPKAFSIDLNGGVMVTNKSYDSLKGFHYGVSGLVAFSSHFRIKLGIKSWILLSNLEDDIEDNPDLPEITFPEDGTLKEIKISSNGLALRGSAEYMFKPIGKFRPFLGLGWLEQVDKKDSYKFEFDTPSGELYLTKEAHYNGPNLHFLTFSVGSDINLHKRLDAYLAVRYSREVNGTGIEYLFFQPGLYYHF